MTDIRGAAAEAGAESGADLRQLLVTLWRGKWAVAFAAVLCAGVAALILSRTAPVYEAAADVLLDPRDRRVTDIRQVVGDLPIDNAIVASEIAVIRSARLRAEVVERLALHETAEFGARAKGLAEQAMEALSGLAPDLAAHAAPLADAPAGAQGRDPRDRARDRLGEAMIVAQMGRSYVIRISVRSSDPERAAATANALAAAYIDDQLAAKAAAAARATGWLNGRIDALKAEVRIAEDAVEAKKAVEISGERGGATVTEQQLGEINKELVAARAGRAEAEARRDQISRLIEAKGRGAAANVLSSPLILTLRQQQAEVKRRQAELATRYGPKHPKMANVKAELGDLSGAIAQEVRKIVAGLENDVEVALAREITLADALRDLEERTVDLSRASVGLRQLEREADASRRIYENFLERWKETSEASGLTEADARIVSEAQAPAAPAAPKKTLITGMVGFGGGLLGLAFVFLGELMVNTFRTGEEAERALGRALLARIPRLKGARRRRAVIDALTANPNSAFAEAARGLRNALILANLDAPPKAVMVTSAAPGEGKTATCLALAHMSALMGRRAVVVECDLRRPRLAQVALEPNLDAPDLIDVLKGDAPPEAALRETGPEGAFILPVTTPAPQAADILSSQVFRDLVADLTTRFDLVLLDTPPALAVSDAAAVGGAADACLFLVRWKSTPRQAAAECIRRLDEMGAPPIGVALTMVDPKREAAYQYGGYSSGAPDYSGYYS